MVSNKREFILTEDEIKTSVSALDVNADLKAKGASQDVVGHIKELVEQAEQNVAFSTGEARKFFRQQVRDLRAVIMGLV